VCISIFDALQSYRHLSENLIEVGPGHGALTKHLIKAYDHYQAIEIDPDMVKSLKHQFPAFAECIIQDDFLQQDLSTLFEGQAFILTGNYPYNISSQILFKMIDFHDQIPVMIGMFQKEVAHRIISKPGSKVYGILSVLTQFYYDGSLVIDIKPEAFDPPPKVDSSVIQLVHHNRYQDEVNFKQLKHVVKQAFSQRRKMLKNTLKSYFVDKEILNQAIFERRPEHLSVDEFIAITKLIEKQNNES